MAENADSVECSGRADCAAQRHVHGCYADYGECDAPGEHYSASNRLP